MLEPRPDTRRRLERVGRLVAGFETPFGLELLSTVHWIALRESDAPDEALIRKVYAWGQRKRRFSPEQILLARKTLERGDWLHG